MLQLNNHSPQSKHPFIGESVRHSFAAGAYLFNQMEKICGIYKITSPSKKIYIGQSIDIRTRLRVYKRGHCKNQTSVYHSIKKYGWESHKVDIIEQCLPNELNEKEIYYIQLFQSYQSEFGMNLKEGGNEKLKYSEQSRIKMREKALGRKPSEETRIKISIAKTGVRQSNEHILKRVLKITGKKRTEIAKLKMGATKRGVSLSPDHRLKLSISHKGQKAWNKGIKKTKPNKL